MLTCIGVTVRESDIRSSIHGSHLPNLLSDGVAGEMLFSSLCVLEYGDFVSSEMTRKTEFNIGTVAVAASVRERVPVPLYCDDCVTYELVIQ